MNSEAAEGGSAGGSAAGSAPPSGRPRQIDPKLIKTWLCIWPCYLDVLLTAAEGRRLPKSLLTDCTNVNVYDLADAAVKLGFSNIAMEGKRHPRSDFQRVGRLRVELREADPGYAAHPTKEALLRGMARVIPTLESRTIRNSKLAEQHAAAMAQHAKATQHMPRKLDKKDKAKKAAK